MWKERKLTKRGRDGPFKKQKIQLIYLLVQQYTLKYLRDVTSSEAMLSL